MRNTVITIATLLLSGALTAQGVFSNKTQSILEKVIQDYPNHFHNIRGEMVSQAHQTAAYKSTLQLPGSQSCIVIMTGGASGGTGGAVTTSSAGGPVGGAANTGGRGESVAGEGYSWTCTVTEDADFEKARARYHDVYTQLSNSIINSGSQKTFILSGQYEEPSADRKVSRVVFSLLPGVGEMKKLRVELLLLSDSVGAYKIVLSVNDHDPVQGAVTVN